MEKKQPKTVAKKAKWLPIDARDILIVSKEGKVLLFGEPITEMELKSLKEEVKALKHFRIWRIFQETLRHKAVEQGFINATNWEMTLSGKMLLHSLGIEQSIVSVIETYQVPMIKK